MIFGITTNQITTSVLQSFLARYALLLCNWGLDLWRFCGGFKKNHLWFTCMQVVVLSEFHQGWTKPEAQFQIHSYEKEKEGERNGFGGTITSLTAHTDLLPAHFRKINRPDFSGNFLATTKPPLPPLQLFGHNSKRHAMRPVLVAAPGWILLQPLFHRLLQLL